ncbi:MAG: TerB family tellurite resistance protein [Sandaracinaceae bacterium]|jgi:uncharacterized tellurite resistance protein B-like protein|nr:TerB family tellurite resistance protein [Sandaracinaceae bacterium]
MPTSLNSDDRMRLMKFVCSFAWADLEIKEPERAYVKRLMRRLSLTPDERKEVEGWLEVPPRAEEVDPSDIPKAHRKLFVDAVRGMIMADGQVKEDERENLGLLEQLLR